MLLGVTVAGYDNGTSGSDAMGLSGPSSVYVVPNGDLYVVDMGNSRVQLFLAGSRLGQTIAGTATMGSSLAQLNRPNGIYVDATTKDFYVADCYNNRIQLWIANATLGCTLFNSSSTPSVSYPVGIRLDLHGNIYVSMDNSVIRWAPNITTGITVAGNIASGSDNQSLSNPKQIDLDSNGQYIYIADTGNHRIQKWRLPINSSTPMTSGVTVAGGYGAGNGANQLSSPQSVYVSKKTGAIYIADTDNYRIQRWDVGATQGVTVAGDSEVPDITGMTPYNGPNQLYKPIGVALDPNETYLYVADQTNNRVQRFILI